MSERMPFSYRCAECGEVDRFSVSEPVVASFWIAPYSSLLDDGEVYNGQPFETEASYSDDGSFYCCHGCGKTGERLSEMAEIVELDDEGAVLRVFDNEGFEVPMEDPFDGQVAAYLNAIPKIEEAFA